MRNAPMRYDPTLPPGRTCRECQFFIGCSRVVGTEASSGSCRWVPNRFTPDTPQVMLPELIERQAEQWREQSGALRVSSW